MNLNEIIQLPRQTESGLALDAFKGGKQINNKKLMGIYPILLKKHKSYLLFSVVDEGKHIAFLVGNLIKDFKVKTLQVKRTWVEPEYRNKGLMTNFYAMIFNLGFDICSDLELSPESMSIWQKIWNRCGDDVKLYDAKTQKFSEIIGNIEESKTQVFVWKHANNKSVLETYKKLPFFITSPLAGWNSGY